MHKHLKICYVWGYGGDGDGCGDKYDDCDADEGAHDDEYEDMNAANTGDADCDAGEKATTVAKTTLTVAMDMKMNIAMQTEVEMTATISKPRHLRCVKFTRIIKQLEASPLHRQTLEWSLVTQVPFRGRC